MKVEKHQIYKIWKATAFDLKETIRIVKLMDNSLSEKYIISVLRHYSKRYHEVRE